MQLNLFTFCYPPSLFKQSPFAANARTLIIMMKRKKCRHYYEYINKTQATQCTRWIGHDFCLGDDQFFYLCPWLEFLLPSTLGNPFFPLARPAATGEKVSQRVEKKHRYVESYSADIWCRTMGVIRFVNKALFKDYFISLIRKF